MFRARKLLSYGILTFTLVFSTAAACLAADSVEQLKHFPLDSLEGVITKSDVQLDKDISSDGKGSLKLTASSPTTFRLLEVHDLHVDNARLLYQARLRTKDIEGKAYLEMWVHVSGKGEFFSRGLQAPLSGTTEWSTQEIPFFLKDKQTADYVKLNLVIDGKGTAWIDDIHLVKAPLK